MGSSYRRWREVLAIFAQRDVNSLIDYCKSYFKFNEDGDYWKAPKKLVEEHLLSPNYRFGREKVNDYTKGVK